MTPIIKFEKAYDSANEFKPGYIKTRTRYLEEKAGPSGKEGYAYFSTALSTAPHIDIFKTLKDIYTTLPSGTRDHGAIVLRGDTVEYSIDAYSDDITSFSQYFLENPTRDGIQYFLIVASRNQSGEITSFNPLITGLLYNHANGKVLGYLRSHKANSSNNVIIELPFGTNYSGYSIQNAGSWSLSGNKITISSVMEPNTNVILNYGSDSVSFKIFPNGYSAGTTTGSVKTVNDFGDYLIAAQMVQPNVKNVLDALSGLQDETIILPPKTSGGIETYVNVKMPVSFISLLNDAPSEEVKNITTNIYKVPVALVPTDNGRVLMIDVLGVSANELKNTLIACHLGHLTLKATVSL